MRKKFTQKLKFIVFFSILHSTFLSSHSLFASDKLIIISPHRKSIQEEFIPKFREYYKNAFKKEVEVDWLDQGGTADDIRFVSAKYAKNPKSSGIDVFWGGGTSAFIQIDEEGYLDKYELPKNLKGEIPEKVAGIDLYSKNRTWYGSALSSFGIFFNKMVLKIEKLQEPQLWADLGAAQYIDNVSQTDPRRSGTATTLNHIILQSLGWEKGWELLLRLGGNTKMFTHSSSDPIKAVVAGNAAISLAIDFYALPKVDELGANKLGFVMPKGQTILDSDPIAILKGAPNRIVAERFVDFVLNKDTQKLLVLPKGTDQGPRQSALGRMAVNTKTYLETEGKRSSAFNPFTETQYLKYDTEKASTTRNILSDLVGVMVIDTHRELKTAWKTIIKNGMKESDLIELSKMPLTEKEFEQLSAKWDNEVLRNKTINEWVKFAHKKYAALGGKAEG
ncbi:MAG: extracellular solute-binding protein [Oligoflexales bacterium]|nr:extracellular solute-binding protein [Oligoflexales bacterium]